ncbi:DUF2977 domain-containing protein [uncultured Anaerofustis sp.]|uniref:DUF2977 domain-containing protein n=1 Tax=uncultured Anaerofustis sp. TaxID=904996 RepID=UPI0025F02600|nr:DUF2977 domain-containing protein [uncultured Anaerofustis sp.]
MNIKLNENDFVVGYSTMGGIDGGIDYIGNVPDDFEDQYYAYYLKNDILIKDDSKIIQRQHRKDLIMELEELYLWFEEYDNQIKQFNRCSRMGISYDRDITKLDSEAKSKQLRIREIRNIL